MGIGRSVRRLFGRYERHIADAWRGAFVNLDAFAHETQLRVQAPRRALEIGCGEGAVTERLALRFPATNFTGIDICEQPGRLFRGDSSRVRFLRATAAQMCAAQPRSYDLIVVADVIHHVPVAERAALLDSVQQLLAPEGVLVLKDWTRKLTPVHLAGYCADRFITGDRVHYLSDTQLRQLAIEAFGSGAIRSEFRVRPWSNNLVLLIAAHA